MERIVYLDEAGNIIRVRSAAPAFLKQLTDSGLSEREALHRIAKNNPPAAAADIHYVQESDFPGVGETVDRKGRGKWKFKNGRVTDRA